jgi:predicted Rossmann fold nucleotide-binding protein DprA/Smf involved in DNA uptake
MGVRDRRRQRDGRAALEFTPQTDTVRYSTAAVGGFGSCSFRVPGMEPLRQLPQNASDAARRIFALLQERALQIDEVIENSGFPPPKVLEVLLELELQGHLQQLPGKRYRAER